MQKKKVTTSHVKIGIMGNLECGRAKLIQAIEKTLKEENNIKLKNETLNEKVKLVSKHKIFVDDLDSQKLDI